MDKLVLGLCLMGIGLVILLFLWQLNNFGKRLKKLEEQLSNK